MILGLSGKKQSGKSTVANFLHDKHAFVIGDFAAPIRIMINDLLRYQGLPEDRIVHLNNDPARDTEIVPELGWRTVRWAQQSLGHDWGRVMMCDSLWINAMANAGVFDNVVVVCQNVRYQDEAHFIRSRDGYIIEIQRPNGHDDDHPSENSLIRPDFKVVNDTTLDNLFFKMSHILKLIKRTNPS